MSCRAPGMGWHLQTRRRCLRTDVIVSVAVEEGDHVVDAVADADDVDVSVAEPLEETVGDCTEGTGGLSGLVWPVEITRWRRKEDGHAAIAMKLSTVSILGQRTCHRKRRRSPCVCADYRLPQLTASA